MSRCYPIKADPISEQSETQTYTTLSDSMQQPTDTVASYNNIESAVRTNDQMDGMP